MTTTVDLTPFGFTPTESRVHNALLDFGPSGGYELARKLGLARANTYHALSSLRAKGAVDAIADRPLRVRAVRPDALVTLIGSRYGERLEVLEQQVRRRGEAVGATNVVTISSGRSLIEAATRMIVREEGTLLALAPGHLYGATSPAWRKRKADGLPSRCWGYGDISGTNPVPISQVDADDIVKTFGPGPVLMATESSAVCVRWDGGAAGWWTQEQPAVGLVRTAIASVGGI